MDRHAPQTLKDASERERRLAEAQTAPHVAGLNEWVAAKNDGSRLQMPWFDPGDAGQEARVLFLLESPGPKADAKNGSGIISIDNADQTATNLWSLRASAGLQERAVHWNVVPFYLGTAERRVKAPSPSQVDGGVELLAEVISLLPELQIVVPMGTPAKRGWGAYCQKHPNNLVAVPTWHPSGQGLASPGKREAAQLAINRVASLVGMSQDPTPLEHLQPRRAELIRKLPSLTKNRAVELRERARRGSRRPQ